VKPVLVPEIMSQQIYWIYIPVTESQSLISHIQHIMAPLPCHLNL